MARFKKVAAKADKKLKKVIIQSTLPFVKTKSA